MTFRCDPRPETFQKMSKGHLLPIIILIEQMHRYTDDGRRVLANAVPADFIAKRFFSNFPERQVRFRMFLQQFPLFHTDSIIFGVAYDRFVKFVIEIGMDQELTQFMLQQ